MSELIDEANASSQTNRVISIAWKRLRRLLVYFISFVITLLALEIVLKLYKVDLSIPLYYSGASMLYGMLTKGLAANDWSPLYVPHTVHLGAPFDFSMHTYPVVADSNLVFLIMKVLSFFTHDWVRLFNYYCILTFFLTVFAAIYALKYYRVSSQIAIVFSILFSFLPYHFISLKSGQLNRAFYALIPLQVLILTWIWSKRPIFFNRELAGRKHTLNFNNFKAIFSLAILGVSGMASLDGNLFFCYLALIAGLGAFIYRKSLRHLLASFILITTVVISSLMNMAPYIKYVRHAQSVEVAASDNDREQLGLKIAQLLLPIDDHRIAWLNKIKAKYNVYPFITENKSAALGIIGSLGLLFLLFYLPFTTKGGRTIFYKLGVLTLFAILFGTIGGFSSLVALLVYPLFVEYYRISLFIAFFSLSSLAFILNKYQTYLRKELVSMGLIVILFFGLYDQTVPAYKYTHAYETRRNEFLSDQEFIKAIESVAQKNAPVFQFPFVEFPSRSKVAGMNAFDHFRGYLHSATLRWSYGAALGRYPVLWYQLTAESPIDPLLYKLSVVGFAGIYIDRYGYPDNGAQLEAALTARLGGPGPVSANGRLCYYDLTAYRDQVLRRIPSGQWAAMQDLVLYPVQADWADGFSALESDGSSRWRWCGADGQLNLINHARRDRMVRLVMEFYPEQPAPYAVVVRGTGFSDTVSVAEEVRRYERVVALPAGGTTPIYFHSDAPPLTGDQGPKGLVFAVYNFNLEDILDQ